MKLVAVPFSIQGDTKQGTGPRSVQNPRRLTTCRCLTCAHVSISRCNCYKRTTLVSEIGKHFVALEYLGELFRSSIHHPRRLDRYKRAFMLALENIRIGTASYGISWFLYNFTSNIKLCGKYSGMHWRRTGPRRNAAQGWLRREKRKDRVTSVCYKSETPVCGKCFTAWAISAGRSVVNVRNYSKGYSNVNMK